MAVFDEPPRAELPREYDAEAPFDELLHAPPNCRVHVWYDAVQMAGNRVRELRERFLLTQEALAFRCRVATRTAVAWEKGEKSPNSRNTKRLAKVLGVSVHELRLGKGSDHGNPDTDTGTG